MNTITLTIEQKKLIQKGLILCTSGLALSLLIIYAILA